MVRSEMVQREATSTRLPHLGPRQQRPSNEAEPHAPPELDQPSLLEAANPHHRPAQGATPPEGPEESLDEDSDDGDVRVKLVRWDDDCRAVAADMVGGAQVERPSDFAASRLSRRLRSTR